MRTIIIYKRLLKYGLAAGLALLTANAAPARSETHRYVVEVDSALRHMRVEARFGSAVRLIRARSSDADRVLLGARQCGSRATIRAENRRMLLPDGGVRCIRYEIDLRQAASNEPRNATLASSNVIVSPAVWLWRPPISDDNDIIVRFDLDEETAVAVPWQPVANEVNAYRILPSPESSRAPAVFGDFDYRETRIPGATLRVSLLEPMDELRRDEIVDWIRMAASNVTLAYGRFPNPATNVVAIPVGKSRRDDSPVPFGRLIRDGGETIEFFINEKMPIDLYHDDWTATHEFSHLMLPYIGSRHRWIAEGFAQYYQNLLLARAGRYTEQRAWQKLAEGFERGRKSGAGLSPNQAAAGARRAATMKIYWSGAAIALLADVEIRQRSDGQRSLDDVLAELQRCCLPAEAMWSGTRLFSKLDSFLDAPVFMPLYRRHADTAEFPDVGPTLARLGVVVENGAIRLDQGAPLAALRAAMTGH